MEIPPQFFLIRIFWVGRDPPLLTKNSEKFSVLNCKCIFVDILVRGAPTFRWEKAAPRLMRLPSAKPSWLKSSVVNLIQKFASLFYFNCVFFQTPTGYWWADLEQGGRGGVTEEWSHGRRHEWSMDWLSRWAVGKCKQNYLHCRNWAASALRHTVLSTSARRGFTFPRRRSGTDMAVYLQHCIAFY